MQRYTFGVSVYRIAYFLKNHIVSSPFECTFFAKLGRVKVCAHAPLAPKCIMGAVSENLVRMCLVLLRVES